MAAKPWIVVPLVLPVGEKEYTIQPIEYQNGLTLRDVLNEKSDAIPAEAEDEEIFRLCMGAAWDEMITDKVPVNLVFRGGMASMHYQIALINDITMADAAVIGEQVWESGLRPEAVAAALAAKQNAQTSKPSTSTATARKTPRRASTKTTTSRTATPRTTSSSKAAPRSRGKQ